MILQFPYCAWEFNGHNRTGAQRICTFNSHTARGSSIGLSFVFSLFRIPSIPILRVGVQCDCFARRGLPFCLQFPYCAWEFNNFKTRCFCWSESFNSHTARGSSIHTSSYYPHLQVPSIPILRVGVQYSEAGQSDQGLPFNSHTARGSSMEILQDFPVSDHLQFPYCAWEFNGWHLQCPFYQVSESY